MQKSARHRVIGIGPGIEEECVPKSGEGRKLMVEDVMNSLRQKRSTLNSHRCHSFLNENYKDQQANNCAVKNKL